MGVLDWLFGSRSEREERPAPRQGDAVVLSDGSHPGVKQAGPVRRLPGGSLVIDLREEPEAGEEAPTSFPDLLRTVQRFGPSTRLLVWVIRGETLERWAGLDIEGTQALVDAFGPFLHLQALDGRPVSNELVVAGPHEGTERILFVLRSLDLRPWAIGPDEDPPVVELRPAPGAEPVCEVRGQPLEGPSFFEGPP